MNKRKGLLAIAAVAILASGCASVPAEKWRSCAIAGAVAGGAIGAFEDDHHDTRDALVGAIGGAVIGGTICALMAEEEKPAVVAAKDSDRDGVMDSLDSCPNTPAGVAVDGKGCALDSDNDGVIDAKDQCPNSAPGAVVNELGCADALVLNGVNFANDSAELTDASKAILKPIAVALRDFHANVALVVSGYTDSIGAASYNQSLSQRRAEAVRAYMISAGSAASNLTAVGNGEASPVADNATAAGRAANRRVELTVK